jgi:hypothetical protein
MLIIAAVGGAAALAAWLAVRIGVEVLTNPP